VLIAAIRLCCRSKRLTCCSMTAGTIFTMVPLLGRRLVGVVGAIRPARSGYRSQELVAPGGLRRERTHRSQILRSARAACTFAVLRYT
jgi:hypothetical protein